MQKNPANSSEGTSIRPSQVFRELSIGLRKMKDPVRARGIQNYFKNEIQAIGITAPVLREFMREKAKDLQRVWQLGEAVEGCGLLLQAEEIELRGAGIQILAAFKKEFTPDLLAQAEQWLETRLDNWALVDSFCGEVLTPMLQQHEKAAKRELTRWSKARSLWVRRAALVTLVAFARRGEHMDLAYRFAKDHFADPEDLIHKATGWLLRETGKTDMARLRSFLLKQGPRIPRTALRYAIERFPAAERLELLNLTRAR